MGSRRAVAVREIAHELAVVRMGQGSAMDRVLPRIREVADLDNICVYSIEDRDDWRLGRWHATGIPDGPEGVKARFLSAPRNYVFYDPHNPPVAARNRLVEATKWIDESGLGVFLESPMVKHVLQPMGLHRHAHLRALICDGAELLAWFGSLVPGTIHGRATRVLTALIPAVQRCLRAERTLAIDGTALAEADETILARAIDGLGAPAWIVSARGRIVIRNAAARTHDDADTMASLRALVANQATDPRLECTAIGTHRLVVLREPISARLTAALARASARWKLSPRQRQVLARITAGAATSTIAAELRISTRAVEQHASALLVRADVPSRAALAAAVLLAPD